ncbi:MAG: MarC family protein [Gemmatimonadota bacterium]
MDGTAFLQALAALLAIANPLGGAPVFLEITDGETPRQRRKDALTASLAVFGILGACSRYRGMS